MPATPTWPWRHRELHVQDWLWVLRNRALGTWVTHRCCLELAAEDTVPSLKAPQKIRHPLFCEIPLPTPLILSPLQSRPRIRDHQASSDARGARCCGGRSGCGPGGLGRAGSSRGSRPRSAHEQEVPRGAMSSFSPHLPPAPSRGCRSRFLLSGIGLGFVWELWNPGATGESASPRPGQADYSLALAHSPEFFLFTAARVTRGLPGGPDQPRALTGG